MENLERISASKARITNTSMYDKRFVKQVVQEIEDGLPSQIACVNYNLKKSTLRNWINSYASPTYLRSRRKFTSPQIKRSVCRSIQAATTTIAQAAIAHNVHYTTIKAWLSYYHEEKADLAVSNLATLKKKKAENTGAKQDAVEVKALQAQLDYANLKVAALNTLIDVAEEQLKINIRKKLGTKQL